MQVPSVSRKYTNTTLTLGLEATCQLQWSATTRMQLPSLDRKRAHTHIHACTHNTCLRIFWRGVKVLDSQYTIKAYAAAEGDDLNSVAHQVLSHVVLKLKKNIFHHTAQRTSLPASLASRSASLALRLSNSASLQWWFAQGCYIASKAGEHPLWHALVCNILASMVDTRSNCSGGMDARSAVMGILSMLWPQARDSGRKYHNARACPAFPALDCVF
eukprot:1146868-Pelagomonas_calceolata.AAC.4